MTKPLPNSPGWWQQSTTRRLVKWLFRWRTARGALVGVAVLVTLGALFYTEENIRGKYAWEQYRRKAEARGEQLDLNAFIPKPIPDDQNFAATPFIKSWFVRTNYGWKSDYYQQVEDHIDPPEAKRDASIRHFLDLVAWSRAFDVIRAGKMTGSQNFASDKLDFESRAKAAPSVLDGLKTNDATFAELRAASQRPFSHYPVDYNMEDPAEILLPHLSKVKGACRRLELKASAELAAGQSEAALEDVKLILRLTDSLNEESFLISYLVRIACVQIAIQPIWEGLAEHAWSDAQLQELQARLQSYNLVADLKWPLDGERAGGIAIMDFVRKRGVGTLLELLGPGQPTPVDKDVADFFSRIVPSGWWRLEQLNYCRLFGLQVAGTFDGANKRVYPDRIQSNIHALEEAFAGRNPFGTIFLRHQLLSTILLPALSKIPLTAAVAQTATEQAVVACALERYRLANGQFPDTLDALVPRFIPELPHDVIVGEPYKYRRTADGQFVLYSAGGSEKDHSSGSGNEDFLGKYIKTLLEGKEGDWVWQYPSL
jgi:hypothetical protein